MHRLHTRKRFKKVLKSFCCCHGQDYDKSTEMGRKIILFAAYIDNTRSAFKFCSIRTSYLLTPKSLNLRFGQFNVSHEMPSLLQTIKC